MSSALNPQYSPAAVPPPSGEALAFHRALPGYAPTPLRDLGGGVWLKDESDRFGLPAFKVLGVSWAVERALREDPGSRRSWPPAPATTGGRSRTSPRGAGCARACSCRPARSPRGARRSRGRARTSWWSTGPTRTRSRSAAEEGARPGAFELADVGASGPAHWVIDGYATLVRRTATDSTRSSCPWVSGRSGAAAARYGAAAGGRDRGRAGRRGVPHRLAARGRADGRRHAGDGDGRPGLRGGVRGGLADLEARHHGTVTVSDERRRRDARARRARASPSGTPAPRRWRGLRRAARHASCRAIERERVLLSPPRGRPDPDGYRGARRMTVALRTPRPPQHGAAGRRDGGLLVGAAARRRGLLDHVRARHGHRRAARARAGDLPRRVRAGGGARPGG